METRVALEERSRVLRGLAARQKTQVGGAKCIACHLHGRRHQVLGQRAAPVVCHGEARAGGVRLVALQRAQAAQPTLEPPPVQPLDSADPVPSIRRRPGGPLEPSDQGPVLRLQQKRRE